MVEIPESVREKLKAPLGEVALDLSALAGSKDRIIAIGDVCAAALLDAGIRPHLAVFDFRSKRRDADPQVVAKLRSAYPNPKKYQNPAGTLSDRLLHDAPRLMENGGGVLIAGEEDLTALAFILSAGAGFVIVYGQPDVGAVIVRPDEELKKRIRGWLKI